MILAFCAMLAVQAAPSTTDFEYDAAGNEIEKRSNWEYDAAGNEIEKRDSFEYDAAGNEIEKRDAFEYDAEGNEIEKRDDEFEYDAEGNEIEKREPKKKAKKVGLVPVSCVAISFGSLTPAPRPPSKTENLFTDSSFRQRKPAEVLMLSPTMLKETRLRSGKTSSTTLRETKSRRESQRRRLRRPRRPAEARKLSSMMLKETKLKIR
jgi:YD repeat-containing protein